VTYDATCGVVVPVAAPVIAPVVVPVDAPVVAPDDPVAAGAVTEVKIEVAELD
jgi:hypothetical protein